MTDKKQKDTPDWERIETEYRAGVLSLREISESQGISHQAIAKRAKASAWDRDLGAKIKAKADALVAKTAVDKQVDTKRVATETQVIEANATMQTNIILAHRKDVQKSRKLCMGLLDELEAQTDNVELFEQLGDLLRNDDEKAQDKRNDIYQKVISFPGRVKGIKDLSDSLRILIGLERQAFGLSDSAEGGDKPDAAMADRMKAARERAKEK